MPLDDPCGKKVKPYSCPLSKHTILIERYCLLTVANKRILVVQALPREALSL